MATTSDDARFSMRWIKTRRWINQRVIGSAWCWTRTDWCGSARGTVIKELLPSGLCLFHYCIPSPLPATRCRSVCDKGFKDCRLQKWVWYDLETRLTRKQRRFELFNRIADRFRTIGPSSVLCRQSSHALVAAWCPWSLHGVLQLLSALDCKSMDSWLGTLKHLRNRTAGTV